MEIDFITLTQAGVGPIVVRFSEIVTMESTPVNCTRIEFTYNESLIVEEDIFCVIGRIQAAKLLTEQNAVLLDAISSQTEGSTGDPSGRVGQNGKPK